jgi:hypothetical protein
MMLKPNGARDVIHASMAVCVEPHISDRDQPGQAARPQDKNGIRGKSDETRVR